jgi:nitroimidazol reductase NimA-like FMN-containing flavoprotein (pyridoxamine 5'-phosphate oxidase superfamily)
MSNTAHGAVFVMYVHEMTRAECRRALEQATLGRLGCARDNQPYVLPIYFAYDGEHLNSCIYGFATLGQKVEWMRSNPLVCLEIDEHTSHDEWMSVIVYGHYEELTDTPEHALARTQAHSLLQRRAMWWEPADVAAEHQDKPHSFAPIYYRIHIDQMTGHRATPDKVESNLTDAKEGAVKGSWLRHMLRRH